MIAAAGSGKTTHLICEALKKDTGNVLITTFTEANESEIRNRIIGNLGYVPKNITIQTWFSFLLQHGVRPYQSVLNDSIHEDDIGFFLTPEKSGKKYDKDGKPVLNSKGQPLFWGEEDFLRCYFTSNKKIYSDKISRFTLAVDKVTKGEIFTRISKIFQHVYIDEVQDLVGYDLELLKLLFKSNSSVLLVGDPRQVTYHTHFTSKHKDYLEGNIKGFVQDKLGKRITCEVDEITLGVSHRNNQLICDYSAKLYTGWPTPIFCNCPKCIREDEHQGVFIVKPKDVDRYIKKYSPVQLRWSSSTKVNPNTKAVNLGESKGSTLDRVLIYPTDPMKNWIRDNTFNLKPEARAKLYVGLTRARLSSTIVMDYDERDDFLGICKELNL